MRWRRRNRQTRLVPVAAELASPSLVPAPRVERVLVALAVHAQQLDGRLERLERRVEEHAEAAQDLPTHDDVLAVRLHSARLAAEVARVTVELRAEIERRTRATAAPAATARERRVHALAETILDLSDGMDTLPRDLVPDDRVQPNGHPSPTVRREVG